MWVQLGCAHSVHIDSDPPGADVYVDGQYIGKTPVAWEEDSGRTDFIPVEVHGHGRVHRFALKRDGIAPGPIALGIAGGVGGVGLGLLGFATYFAMYFAGIIITSEGNPNVGVPILMLSLVPNVLGSLLFTLGIHAPFIAVGEYGRIGPDSVQVDLTNGQEHSEPPGRTVPLLGRSPLKKTPKKGKNAANKEPGAARQKNDAPTEGTDGIKKAPEGKLDTQNLDNPSGLHEE
jgi:hypothetical protein